MGLVTTMYSSLFALAVQIDSKSEEEQNANLRSCKQKAGGLETVDADYERNVRAECWR